ncbi:cytochrome c nitrite reductase small subunit [Schaalia sp. 19OD2882]|uniref:cytochrome c nitrite reductase small subunit n=1 Tax=Schaalia sp. 19OD2882 TaxID=2794089 RepID=UPI001C1EC051|nr:cytochrome c nitrite reductase small subunit [Schaalia sp. 19OD2882]QWW18898.1 cytochrome c nitrite reductase small subunit [Schaalia sp. 19OD2882]
MAVTASRSRLGPGSILMVLAAFSIGVLAGLAVYTFVYAKGYSYLSSDPNACVNCHVMQEQYDGWVAGHHRHTAVCADCHLPHDNIVNKYYVKAENGFWHGLKFTTGWYPQNIVARPVSLDVTNKACLHCHANITNDIRHSVNSNDPEVYDCVRCHSGVGHE